MKRQVLDNIKNLPGWRTAEKLIVFAVDDYGNICLNSPKARENLESGGLKLTKHIERLDSLETRQDLDMLFETLGMITDCRGRSPVITANTLCANLDFSSLNSGIGQYSYISLPETFASLSVDQPAAYDGAWKLWQEGMAAGLLRPQFHGREHLNVEFFERKLRADDAALMLNLDNNSLVGIGREESMPGVRLTEAFGIWQQSELDRQREIIADGLDLFETVFGFRSATVVPPGTVIHPDLYGYLESLGARGIDKPQRCVRRLDRENQKREWNPLGTNSGQKHVSLIRNVVFEPTKDRTVDSVSLAMQQIEAAFRWRKPAIISSHRVNFGGHIEVENRRIGLGALKKLLEFIVRRWPDVQFISSDELVKKISPAA